MPKDVFYNLGDDKQKIFQKWRENDYEDSCFRWLYIKSR
jgi:hypothetical protein